MITAGIDIGHQSVNVAIMDGDRLVDHGSFVTAGGVEAAARRAFDATLEKAGLKSDDVDSVFATGVGREQLTFAHGHRTEMSSHVAGAHREFPGARTVIDLGAEGSRISRCDAEGRLANFMLNDKCASGTGVFLETVAGMLAIPISEVGPLSLDASKAVELTTTCAVFAESEIVAEIHRGSSKEDILGAVNQSIAAKVVESCRRFGVEPEIVLTGGVARNVGVVDALQSGLGLEIRVPESPEIAGAVGAAILARVADSQVADR
jgi:predicted CoA-substrate-specific enzyme activase